MTETTSYQNWKNYFKGIFEGSNYCRIHEGLHGDTIKEKYVPVDSNDKTIISVGYLDDKLIYWIFNNPIAVGFNKQQEVEYFYRYDFAPGNSYGSPGLEFNEINIKAISKQLREGLFGKEIQYFLDGEHIKSEIYQTYEDSKPTVPQTIYFKRNSWKRKILNFLVKSSTPNFEIKEIDLHEIFVGIKTAPNPA